MDRTGLADYLRKFKNPLDISICNDRKIIYMRTPKTASSSIAITLGKTDPEIWKVKRRKENKKLVDKILNTITDKELEDYFIFLSVRNPFDRVISTLAYTKKLSTPESFKKYNKWESLKNSRHGREQHLFTHLNDTRFVDYIIRYETLEEDILHLAKIIGIKKTPKLAHVLKSKHQPYKAYYNQQTIEIVSKLYEKDLKLLEYSYA